MNNPYFIYWFLNGEPPSGVETVIMIVGMIILALLFGVLGNLMGKKRKRK